MSDLSNSNNNGSDPPDDEKQGQNHQEQQCKVQDDDESGNDKPANNAASSGNGKCLASAAGVATTARKRQQKKKKGPQIGKGKHVKATQKNSFCALPTGSVQQNALVGVADDFNCHGAVTGGSGKKMCNVEFDQLPHGHQAVDKVRRTIIGLQQGIL